MTMPDATSTPRLHIGIAGAGLLGRLLAHVLSHLGHQVTVFDPAPGPHPQWDGQGPAGFTAAGMLSPLAELDKAEVEVAAMGWRSLALWPALLAQAGVPGAFQCQGSWMLAHRADLGSAQRVLNRLSQAGPDSGFQAPVATPIDTLRAQEPMLAGASHAWFLPGEGQVNTEAALVALVAQASAQGARFHWGQAVSALSATQLTAACTAHAFDRVIDVRGTGARPDLPVRGVRGEVVHLHLPAHGLTRPVRLLHPRHRVYLVPRNADTVLLGASEIESEDRSPVSLQTAVELMAAAHSVMPSLAEARILRLDVNLRPALPHHRPEVHGSAEGAEAWRINGLYRHGWLLAPACVEQALAQWGLASRDLAHTMSQTGAAALPLAATHAPVGPTAHPTPDDGQGLSHAR